MHSDTLEQRFTGIYEEVYDIDLVFRSECWTLCGDAHCCHFSRYKATRGEHEIPLLPGEWNYLCETGKIGQYGTHTRSTLRVDLSIGALTYDSLKISAVGCPCTHDLRPTACRLYPLLPVFSTDGRLVGLDMQFSVFDVIEQTLGASRACSVREIPFVELQKFLDIARVLGSDPVLVFHLVAYKHVKDIFAARVAEKVKRDRVSGHGDDAIVDLFSSYRSGLVEGLMNWTEVKEELEGLGRRFRSLYGPSFAL